MTPRSPDLAIFVVIDRHTNKQTDKLPLAHARGVKMQFLWGIGKLFLEGMEAVFSHVQIKGQVLIMF